LNASQISNGLTDMQVLRVQLEAPICSFRYPHFLVGRQLSFDMPPPATIYGHVASVLGEFPDPRSFRFAYWFSTTGKGEDLENQHIIVPGGSRPFSVDGAAFPSSTSATIQPTRRQFLFGCRMTLYIDGIDFADAFRSPRFAVVLGRSQDLAAYSKVEVVDLVSADSGYYEETILPAEFRRRTARGVTVLMPRYVAPPPFRQAFFERYIMLRERIYDGQDADLGSRRMLRIAGEANETIVDLDSPEWRGAHRALVFHSFA
jgi:CRISPR-associated protein Cas5t